MSEPLPIASKCVECGEVNTRSSSVSGPDQKPEPGHIAICFYCGHIAAVADDYTLRPLTDEEMYEIAGDRAIIEAQELRVRILENMKEEAENDGER